MTNQQAKQRLFKSLDEAIIKHGSDHDKMVIPGFFPHYSEIESDNLRPTWYTEYQLDADTSLITMYDTKRDICISTLMVVGQQPITKTHTGYPRNLEDAKHLAEILTSPE